MCSTTTVVASFARATGCGLAGFSLPGMLAVATVLPIRAGSRVQREALVPGFAAIDDDASGFGVKGTSRPARRRR